jgi:tetratricopeptide (TPR) repeat protein
VIARFSTWLALLTWLCTSSAHAVPSDADLLQRSIRALDAADVESADTFLRELSPSGRNSPEARAQRGMVRFYQGAYGEGTSELEQAVASAPKSPHLGEWRRVSSWVKAARDLTRDFAEAKSADGRYVIRYAQGVDEVLVRYALDTLARADRAIETQLGIRLPSPVRLEVYPSARALSEVSSLTIEHIETSGTVALCKWNRLMIASPRSLLYGYPWLDTIQHELVHLALARGSRNEAPVWFHEGLAKLFERTWRGAPAGAYLAPATEDLLVAAAKNGKLIPFERMHPSIAMLPSQEEAALAFAQVVTFLEGFMNTYGSKKVIEAIGRMAQGRDAREALAEVAGSSFSALEESWRKQLRARPAGHGKVQELKLRFVSKKETADESLDVPEERARKHLRIGDLLWGRGRKLGATREYERARKYAPNDPILASRVARGALSGGEAARGLKALETALEEHPSHAPLHALRGEALIALGKLPEGMDELREAIRLNPFDPGPHCGLAQKLKQTEEGAYERRACVLLGGPALP